MGRECRFSAIFIVIPRVVKKVFLWRNILSSSRYCTGSSVAIFFSRVGSNPPANLVQWYKNTDVSTGGPSELFEALKPWTETL